MLVAANVALNYQPQGNIVSILNYPAQEWQTLPVIVKTTIHSGNNRMQEDLIAITEIMSAKHSIKKLV